jgi:hypothetical protein
MLKSQRKDASANKRNRKTGNESDPPRGKCDYINHNNGNDDAAAISDGRNSEKGVGQRLNRGVNRTFEFRIRERSDSSESEQYKPSDNAKDIACSAMKSMIRNDAKERDPSGFRRKAASSLDGRH